MREFLMVISEARHYRINIETLIDYMPQFCIQCIWLRKALVEYSQQSNSVPIAFRFF
jgi:hypothetical protein